MKLYKLSSRIFYSAYEEERDRPSLGYIRGDNYSIAIDAGHSDDHVNEFYAALKREGLPLPALTIITHWHWDHSFAMHAISGLSVSGRKTDQHLRDFIAQRSEENDETFLHLDPSITKEYENGRPLIVVPSDIVFDDGILFDAGNIEVKAFQTISPHTDDAVLIHVPKEKTLFIGDAISGVFPTWIADPDLTRELIKTIEAVDAETIIGGHWEPFTRQKLLKELNESL